MTRTLMILLTIVGLFASLSACGRRGPLEAPSASADPASSSAQTAPVEDKPFVLDGLIQ